jgi:hypothetical protein
MYLRKISSGLKPVLPWRPRMCPFGQRVAVLREEIAEPFDHDDVLVHLALALGPRAVVAHVHVVHAQRERPREDDAA